MIKDPRRTLNAINNRVTVALPLTSIDIHHLSKHLSLQLEDLLDVDLFSENASDKKHGVILQYNEETKKWQSVRQKAYGNH